MLHSGLNLRNLLQQPDTGLPSGIHRLSHLNLHVPVDDGTDPERDSRARLSLSQPAHDRSLHAERDYLDRVRCPLEGHPSLHDQPRSLQHHDCQHDFLPLGQPGDPDQSDTDDDLFLRHCLPSWR